MQNSSMDERRMQQRQRAHALAPAASDRRQQLDDDRRAKHQRGDGAARDISACDRGGIGNVGVACAGGTTLPMSSPATHDAGRKRCQVLSIQRACPYGWMWTVSDNF